MDGVEPRSRQQDAAHAAVAQRYKRDCEKSGGATYDGRLAADMRTYKMERKGLYI